MYGVTVFIFSNWIRLISAVLLYILDEGGMLEIDFNFVNLKYAYTFICSLWGHSGLASGCFEEV